MMMYLLEEILLGTLSYLTRYPEAQGYQHITHNGV
jgi:hypothetical protein